jgi:rod shape-determining protein MreC
MGVITIFNEIKSVITNTSHYISERVKIISNNLDELESLKEENKKLNSEINRLNSLLYTCKDYSLIKKMAPNLVLAYAISYVSLPDFSKIYISYNKPISHPKGLVFNNYVAGVVTKNLGKYSIALLNSNEKTTYTVFIGKNQIPGIFYGKENLIKYIPQFKKINVGDLVITSGLDGVFYKGAMVGKIVKVYKKKLYQEARVRLFYNDLNPSFFYVVEKPIETNLTK